MAATVLKFRDSSNVLQIPNAFEQGRFPSQVSYGGLSHIKGYFNYKAEDGKVYTLPGMLADSPDRIVINTDAFGKCSVGVSSAKNIYFCKKDRYTLAGINDFNLFADTTATGNLTIPTGTYTQSQFVARLNAVGFNITDNTSKGKTIKTTKNVFSVVVDGKVFTCTSKKVTVWTKLSSPNGFHVCDFGNMAITDSSFILGTINNFSGQGCYIVYGNQGEYPITVLTTIVFN